MTRGMTRGSARGTSRGDLDKAYDVLVIGAGPAGSCAAIRAAQAGRSVLVVDRSGFERRRVGEHLSGLALGPLAQLGWFPEDHPHIARAVTAIRSLWGAGEVVERRALHDPYGFGFAVERPAFERSLHRLACAQGAAVLTRTRFLRRQATTGVIRVTLSTTEGPRIVHARRLVDASGRSATLARGRAYQTDRMICCHFLARFTAAVHDPMAMIVEAQRDGWWYALGRPGADNGAPQAVAGFFSDAQAYRRSGLSPGGWVRAQLAQSTLLRGRLEPASITEAQLCSSGSRVHQGADARAVSIGDAHQVFDPLSQLGLAKAICSSDGPEFNLSRYLEARGTIYAQGAQRWSAPFWSARAPSAIA